jgi:hypothetical protein
VTTWSASGGTLYLGTSVYLRDDSGSGSPSLVGTWIEANGYAMFRFAADGTYDFSDPARGYRSQGTYAVEGRTLTISPSGVAPASFGLDYDGIYLRFANRTAPTLASTSGPDDHRRAGDGAHVEGMSTATALGSRR